MVADDNVLIVEIDLDDKKLKSALKKTAKESEQAGKKTGDGFEKAVSARFKRLALSAAALGSVIASALFSKASIAAAAKQEQALTNLNTALANAGGFSKEASESFQDLARSIQESTTFGDEVILQQLAIARVFARSNDEAKNLVSTAVDLSAATGLTLESAVRNLGKTFSGLAGELGETVPLIRTLTTEQLIQGDAITLLGEKYKGLAAAQTKTFTGATSQFSNAFGDLLESIGDFVVKSPAIITTINAISTAILTLSKSLSETAGSKDFFIDIITDLAIVLQASTETARRIGLSFELAWLRATQAWQAFQVATTLGLSSGFNAQLKETVERIDAVKAEFEERSELVQFFDDLIFKLGETNGKLIELKNNTPGAGSDNIEDLRSFGEAFDLFTVGFVERADELVKKSQTAFKAVGKAALDGIGRGVGQAFAAFGSALAKGENALEAFLGAALNAFGQIAIQLGTQFILQGVAYKFSGLPNLVALSGPLIAAGAALATFGGVLTAIGSGGGESASGGGGAGVGGVSGPVIDSEANIVTDPTDEIQEKRSLEINLQSAIIDPPGAAQAIAELLTEFDDRNDIRILS